MLLLALSFLSSIFFHKPELVYHASYWHCHFSTVNLFYLFPLVLSALAFFLLESHVSDFSSDF